MSDRQLRFWIVQIQTLNRAIFKTECIWNFEVFLLSSVSVSRYYSTGFLQLFTDFPHFVSLLGHTRQKCQKERCFARVCCKMYTGALSHTAQHHSKCHVTTMDTLWKHQWIVGCASSWSHSHTDDVHHERSHRSYTKSQFELSLFTHSHSRSALSQHPSVDISLHLLFAFRCYIIRLEKETNDHPTSQPTAISRACVFHG